MYECYKPGGREGTHTHTHATSLGMECVFFFYWLDAAEQLQEVRSELGTCVRDVLKYREKCCRGYIMCRNRIIFAQYECWAQLKYLKYTSNSRPTANLTLKQEQKDL